MILSFSASQLSYVFSGLNLVAEDVIMDRGALTPGEVISLTINSNSVVRSIFGTGGIDQVQLWRDSYATGTIDLGDGNDELRIGRFTLDTAGPIPTRAIPAASLQGGNGYDKLFVEIRHNLGFDGANTTGFEQLWLNLDRARSGDPASGRSAVVSNITGVEQLVVDSLAKQTTELLAVSPSTVTFSNIAMATGELVTIHVGARIVLENTVTLGSIRSTYPSIPGPGGWWLLGQEFDMVSAATINGNVEMSGRSDYFDGRAGTVGGVIRAFAGNDQIWSGADADDIDGGDGNDVLYGMGGDDLLKGANGADTMDGGDGADILQGGWADDILTGGAGADQLDGGDGFDLADYSTASAAITLDLANAAANTGDAIGDTMIGIERIRATAFADTLRGDSGDNQLLGEDGNDTLEGRGGNDTLRGGAGTDILTGGDGDDLLEGGAGADQFDGGSGTDYVYYTAAAAAVVVDLANSAANTGEAAGDSFVSIEGTVGSAFGDTLRGSALVNVIYGGAGADLIEGRDGDDVLAGEEGNDYLYGGLGNDMLFAGTGSDYLDGGDGFDYANYSGWQTVNVDLANTGGNGGAAAGHSHVGIEGVIGGAAADSLKGNALGNWLHGGDGNDSLWGFDGQDFLIGGNQNDTLNGGNGNDNLYGDAGTDTLNGDAGTDVLFGGSEVDTLNGGDGTDHLIGGQGADVLNGGAGFDYAHYEGGAIIADLLAPAGNTGEAAGDSYSGVEGIVATGFDDLVLGDNGGNWIYGAGGNDFLYGRDGLDYLIGGNGGDYLFGGAGTDVLYGEAGADWFVFAEGDGIDYVGDFRSSDGDAIYLVAASLGVTSFADVQARMVQSGGDTIIGFSGNAILVVLGVTPEQLTAGDFIFG